MLRRTPKQTWSARFRAPLTRYVPESVIARGGMAEIWRARAYVESGETYPVAIKRVLPELAGKPIFSSMFVDEVRLGMMLRHPNIVKVYDARVIKGAYLMIMELVEGVSLKDLLSPAQDRSQPMPVHTAAYMMREIAQALDYAHNALNAQGEKLGVVHCDVSPHNVLLSKDGAVKLLDFGVARANFSRALEQSDMAGGKLGYVAPEILSGVKPHPGVDIFAAGVVMWEALAGARLFLDSEDAQTIRNVLNKPVPSLRSINPSVPEALDALVSRCLERDPEKRVASARALSDALASILSVHFPNAGPQNIAIMASMHLASKHAPGTQSADGISQIIEELNALVSADVEASDGEEWLPSTGTYRRTSGRGDDGLDASSARKVSDNENSGL